MECSAPKESLRTEREAEATSQASENIIIIINSLKLKKT